MPNKNESARMIVNGRFFEDWKSVMVEHRLGHGSNIFEFTATEKAPMAPNHALLQFKPGDRVQIELAGHLAIDGYITHREVAYDAEHHAVRLIGRSKTYDLERGSIDTKTGSFDGYPFLAIARALTAPFGIQVYTVGAIDNTPFERMQVMPGERVFSFLARLGAYRDLIVSPVFDGNLMVIGPHNGKPEFTLVEGTSRGNILKANCELSDEHVYEKYWSVGQQAGDDRINGDAVSKQKVVIPGSLGRYRPQVAPSDLAGSMYDVRKRTEFEARWCEGSKINAEITVQGWLSPLNNDLWRVRTYPMVKAPMLIIDHPLGIKRARFTQDDRNGTLTMLECVLPWHIHGQVDWSGKLPLDAPSGAADVT
jgi:prophage tail gpP-like protein